MRLRKQYVNVAWPMVVLRFEDGHEIRIPQGHGKSFEVFAGETIRVVAIWDPTSGERELLASRRGEEFEDARIPENPS